MRVLITGSRGQLAQEFQRVLPSLCHDVLAPPEETLDISDSAAVQAAMDGLRPDLVINCAAYNHVDMAETERERAFAANALGPGYLAAACRDRGAFLIHYSTDYVFNGTKEDFYCETDMPDPINCYGATKLEGERRVIASEGRFLLFRTSWVFGHGSQNFLYKLRQWAYQQPVLKVVADQISVPTSTEDIVRFTLLAYEQGLEGLYHLTNSGYATRYEVARYFLEKAGVRTLVLPVTSDLFPGAAKRPYFTAMSNRKLSSAAGIELPDWKDAISRFAG